MSKSDLSAPMYPRRHHRFPADQVFVSLDALNLEGEVLDVSQEGLCVEFAEPHKALQQGTVWEFTINLHETVSRVPGKIVWTNETNNTYGVEFTTLTPAQAAVITDFIAYHTTSSTTRHQEQILQDLEV